MARVRSAPVLGRSKHRIWGHVLFHCVSPRSNIAAPEDGRTPPRRSPARASPITAPARLYLEFIPAANTLNRMGEVRVSVTLTNVADVASAAAGKLDPAAVRTVE